MECVISTIIDTLADILDWLQRFQVLIPIVLLLILFFTSLFSFNHKCKRLSNRQLMEYSSSGKYIKGLFVELNESREYLRAFCYDRLWKQKVINRYNTLFDDYMGKELTKVYASSHINSRIPFFYSFKKVKEQIAKMKEFILSVINRDIDYNPDYKNTNVRYEVFGNASYLNNLKSIETMSSFLDSNYLIITSRAGNGKSMMLCSVADQLIRSKESVIFLNARDIREDLIKYISKHFVQDKIAKFFNVWWIFECIIHFIKRKNIYILIDAINECKSFEFLESFTDSLNKLLVIGNVKIIVTCRSEYYEIKYKQYLTTEDNKAKISFLYLQEGEYSVDAIDKLIFNYKNHYRFTGELSDLVKYKITNQLLLVRILFETYEGQNVNIYELNKYKLYKKYIENIKSNNLKTLIDQLARYMYDKRAYENVPLDKVLSDLNNTDIIDESILLCRTIISHEGTIREKSKEVVNFVYDEMRDYKLTTYLLDLCETNSGDVDDHKIKLKLIDLQKHGAMCLEGIINYLFIILKLTLKWRVI